MKIENEVKELLLEARKLKYSDNTETGSHGTFGYVSQQLQEWYDKCEELILNEAGIYSDAWKKFESVELDIVNGNYKDKFNLLKGTVSEALKSMLLNSEIKQRVQSKPAKAKVTNKKIFIVHGHEEGIKNKVARFVEKIGYEPIILHEQASSGKTIIEKIESFSNVNFGIVLYTACDEGRKAREDEKLKKRARQNVVFEHGYLIGKIGRNNVCALVDSEVEVPNDISGVIYIKIDENEAWKYTLAKEMKVANLEVDMNKI